MDIMVDSVKQKIDDFANVRTLLALKQGQQLEVRNGLLAVSREPLLPKKQKEVRALLSFLLSRIEVGIGLLTAENVHDFVFEKLRPLHNSPG